jgi:glycosyltransferase involved in cell wall biosynthesis
VSNDIRPVRRVSIGLPVFNGERFLARAIDSILHQEFCEFELVISDNASTDATQEIGRSFSARDERVSYIRHDVNRGPAWNWSHLVLVTSAPLFKWAAHDDELLPSWLARCVAALDEAPEAVVAYSRRTRIDAAGNVLAPSRPRPKRFLAPDAGPGERLADFLARTTSCIEAFGVIRRRALERTRLVLPFPASDRVLLAELVLQGRFVEIPDELFLHREHEGRSIRQHARAFERAAWFDPVRGPRVVMPTWRLGWEYLRAIERSSLSGAERARARRGLADWAFHRRHILADNLLDAARFARQARRSLPT